MRFVSGGPDVPDNLRRAHEEGKVIFFCGAGISVPAGLPLFQELAKKMFEAAKIALPDSLDEPDRALLMLQKAINDSEDRQRATLIEFLWDALDIQRKSEPEQHYHKSLLTLSATKDGTTKLVTTNFDRILSSFCIAKKQGQSHSLCLVSQCPT